MAADLSGEPIEFKPIAFIETCFKERFGTPRQPGLVPSSWGIVHLRPELNLADALDGLEGFSHIWLIFAFNQNTNKGLKRKVHPPRLEGQKIGLFSTRTPHRPNPIGLSAVKLEGIEGNKIHVSGVDILNGTPILDIKPYLPSADSRPDALIGWAKGRPERTIRVEFTGSASADFVRYLGNKAERGEQSVRQILELDPRPVFYRGSTDHPNPYTDLYGFRFDDFNVIYRMIDDLAQVHSLEPWKEHETRRANSDAHDKKT